MTPQSDNPDAQRVIDPERDALDANTWSRLLSFGARRRVPVVLQTEAAECGLACLAMIGGYHGQNIDMLSLRSRFPTSLRGARLQDLMDIGNALGFASRPVQVDLEKLNHLHLPCVLHWDMRHFVVLTKVRGGSIEVVDPARGRQRMTLAEAGKHFTGVALEIEPGPKMERQDLRQPISLRSLAGSVSGLGRGLLQIFALAIFLEVLALMAPQFLRMILDQVIADSDESLLAFLGVSFLLLLLVRTVVEALRTWTVMWLSSNINIGWTGNVFNHLLRLPMDYFSKRYLGDIISRFSAVTVIQQTLTTKFVVVLIDGLMATTTAMMLFYYNWRLASIVVVFAAIYAGLRILYFRSYREANLKQINVAAHQQSALIESLRGMQAIRLNNRMAQRSSKYMNSTADVLNTSIVVQKLNLLFDSMSSVTTGSQRVIVLWLGAWFALQGSMTAGMLMVFVAYADMFTTRFVGLADYLVQFRLLRLQAERLADIVLTPPEKHVDGTYVGTLKHHGLSFSNVSFQYAFNSRMVLNECSFEIADGEVVAITGASGCGKSTVAKVLLGVVDHGSGTVKIGGIDIRLLGKRTYRDFVASVMQDDQLFSGTILENITFFDPSATLERAQAAAEKANLADDIEAMPMGYQTMIGDMGSTLSGGQSQRLLLARALYREPKILVLDEATSHLDLHNESRICDAVKRAGITTLIIAHRPQTIQSADRVLVMRDGKVLPAPGRRSEVAEPSLESSTETSTTT
ncbi:MAG TPA: peptidase domain-containing ABC transporter [Xanthomonadaceae bacterium]